MKTIRIKSLRVLLPLLILIAPLYASAASASWSQVWSHTYESNRGASEMGIHMTMVNPGTSIDYYGNAYLVNADDSVQKQLMNNDTLHGGDRVLFSFPTHEDQDIRWYATGAA